MELATELDLYLKSHVASEHNYKQEIVYIEEARQELYHQAQILSKEKEKMTALGGILEDRSKSGHNSSVYLILINTALATLAS